MIVEALLALLVIAAVGTGMGMNEYKGIVYPAAGASNPVLAFALSMGV